MFLLELALEITNIGYYQNYLQLSAIKSAPLGNF